MNPRNVSLVAAVLIATWGWLVMTAPVGAQPANNPTYTRIKAYLDSVSAIDTHDHLWPFDKLPGYVVTADGKGHEPRRSLAEQLSDAGVKQVTAWPAGGKFEDWWATAKRDFDDVRAVSFYRYQATALNDLYGVDFDRITDAQAADLNRRIYRNYLTRIGCSTW